MKINGIEFDVVKINRKQRRKLLRDYNFDLVKFSCELMEKVDRNKGMDAFSNGIPIEIDTASLDAVLDVCYPNKDEDLDKIGLTGQMTLFGATIACSVSSEDSDVLEEVKN